MPSWCLQRFPFQCALHVPRSKWCNALAVKSMVQWPSQHCIQVPGQMCLPRASCHSDLRIWRTAACWSRKPLSWEHGWEFTQIPTLAYQIQDMGTWGAHHVWMVSTSHGERGRIHPYPRSRGSWSRSIVKLLPNIFEVVEATSTIYSCECDFGGSPLVKELWIQTVLKRTSRLWSVPS